MTEDFRPPRGVIDNLSTMDEARVAFASIGEQRAWLADGRLTVPQLVSLYLTRIERLDPRLNAFVSVRAAAALEEAAHAQQLVDQGDRRPLLGIPFAVKDEHHLAGERTSFGTGAVGPLAARDGEIVRALRTAGAIPIGKTAMPELGMHPFTESPTWGITRNPWDLSRTPGGSSGGSAAAVAAGLTSFATAGDGGGSIRIPASCCNLFGLKVQQNRVDTEPPISIASDLSVAGVLTRRVGDTALLYDLLAVSASSRGGSSSPWSPSLSAAADTAAPRRLRIGLAFALGLPAAVASEVRNVITAFAARLDALDHEVVDVEIDLGRWDIPFALLGMRLLADEACMLEHPERLDRRTRSAIRTASIVHSRLMGWARRRQETVTRAANSVFDRVDLVLTPTLAQPPVEAGRWEGRGSLRTSREVARWCPYTSLANFIGNPAASVPAGFTDSGLPVGAGFLAPRDAEPTLVAIAAELERELRWYDAFPRL